MQEVEALTDWVAEAVAEPTLSALPAGASTRRFYRVVGRRTARNGAASYIAMAASAETEDNARFVYLAAKFRGHGLATPKIHAFDQVRGFVLMEDLGATDFATAYGTYDVEELLYEAMRTLALLRTLPSDSIPPYTTERFSDELDIFTEWLVERFLGRVVPDHFAAVREALVDATQTVPMCVVHRDYHCRNLIWRPDDTVGIVDFQDALIGPVCYDIASLLRDCYVTFPESDVRRWRQCFFRLAGSPCAEAVFDRAFDLTAIQRQLKAVGIFARLFLSRGRRSHLGDIVPVLERIATLAAMYPETAPLAAWLADDIAPAAASQMVGLA